MYINRLRLYGVKPLRWYRLEVLVPPERLAEARQLFMSLGKRLGQRAIYFEVREGARSSTWPK